MEEETTRKRGGQEGNQNARKHGFYSNRLDEDELKEFEQAIKEEGLDAEIALLRVKIKSVITRDPENLKLIIHGTNALARLIIAKNHISKNDKQTIKDGIHNVLKDIAMPIGTAAITAFIR
jgi:hypothetical protein